MKKFVLIFFIMLLTSSAFAQGEYLFKGNSGFEFGVGLTSINQGSTYHRKSSTITATSPFMAYSFDGVFDIGFVHTTQSTKTSQAIGATVHLLNSYSVPFKLAVSGSVSFLDGEKYFTLSPTFHMDVQLSQTSFAKFKISTSVSEETDNATFTGVVLYNRDNPVIPTFSAGIVTTDGTSNLSVAVSFVFPTAKLRNDPSKKEPRSSWDTDKNEDDEENSEKKKIKIKKYYGD